MIFKFSKKKVQDFIKVVQFMDKEDIDYEILGDLSVAVSGAESDPQSIPLMVTPVAATVGTSTTVEDNDPLWRPTDCPEGCCDSRDKSKCKHNCHYGAMPLD